MSASCLLASSSAGAGFMSFSAMSERDRSTTYFWSIFEVYSSICGTSSLGTSRLGLSASLPPLPLAGGGFLPLASFSCFLASSAAFASSAFFSSSHFLSASASSLACASSVSFSNRAWIRSLWSSGNRLKTANELYSNSS